MKFKCPFCRIILNETLPFSHECNTNQEWIVFHEKSNKLTKLKIQIKVDKK